MHSWSRKMTSGLLLFLVLTVAGVTAQKESSPYIEYDSSADTVLVVMKRVNSEIANLEAPTLTVYGDGTVTMTYPVFMKKAGTWTMQLSEAELEKLLSDLAVGGVYEADSKDLKNKQKTAKESIEKATGELSYRSHQEITELTLNLAAYASSSADKAAAQPITDRKLKVYDLQIDAEKYNVTEIDKLAEAEQKLLDLVDSESLVKQ